jgi:hypothetical protein
LPPASRRANGRQAPFGCVVVVDVVVDVEVVVDVLVVVEAVVDVVVLVGGRVVLVDELVDEVELELVDVLTVVLGGESSSDALTARMIRTTAIATIRIATAQ